ncbi:MAG: hypothetical protein ACO1N1_19725 [Dyadobacter fermentans]
MKKLHTAGNLLKGLLLASMFTACQNEDILTPNEKLGSVTNEQNAKTSGLVKRLIEDGAIKLHYVKSGRNLGQLWYVIDGTNTTYYTFSDISTDGIQWITAKTKNQNGYYVKEMTYKVQNGICVKSFDLTNNKNYIFTYNEVKRLNKIQQEGTQSIQQFNYLYFSAVDSERLMSITYSNTSGVYKEVVFQYGGNGWGNGTPILDKYPLNNEFIGLDKYLQIFGKFSEALVSGVSINQMVGTDIQSQIYYNYTNWLDSDGVLITRWRTHYPFGSGNNTNAKTEIFQQKYGYIGGI